MALEHNNISDNVIKQLDGMGIMSRVDNDESHTAKMIRVIVEQIVRAIINDSEIRVIKSTSFGSNGGGPMTTELMGFGECDIR